MAENIWFKENVTGWRKLHNEEFHNLYTSSNMTGIIKWRRKGQDKQHTW
jgi:hypothetical protein